LVSIFSCPFSIFFVFPHCRLPIEGFKSLAKDNTEIGKDVQKRYKIAMQKFTCDATRGCEKSESDDDAPILKPLMSIPPQQNLPKPFTPEGQYHLLIDRVHHNYLPEKLLQEKLTLPP
jgi:hypothetical protein